MSGYEPREPGALGDEALEVRHRHELRRWLRVHVDELGEEELDPVLLGALLDRLGGGPGHGCRHRVDSLSRIRTANTPTNPARFPLDMGDSTHARRTSPMLREQEDCA